MVENPKEFIEKTSCIKVKEKEECGKSTINQAEDKVGKERKVNRYSGWWWQKLQLIKVPKKLNLKLMIMKKGFNDNIEW